jgi:8-oxo-dGTP pyrophosphatase MutT (NUDIX family)
MATSDTTQRPEPATDGAAVRIVSRRLIGENTRFHVFFEHVADGQGHEVPDYLVVAPKKQSGNMVTGVAILPVIDGQIGLVRIYRPAIRDWSWEIPHGFVEEGEGAHASAIRELVEEGGITCESVTSLGYITPDSGILAARVHLFVASGRHRAAGATGEIGLREFRLFPQQEFEQMIRESSIQDTFTLAAWCRYRLTGAAAGEQEREL